MDSTHGHGYSMVASLGGSTGLLFGSVYPDSLEKLVLLDLIKPVILPLPWHEQSLNLAIETLLETEKRMVEAKCHQRGAPLEELISRYLKGTHGSLTLESCRVLMKRGTRPAPDGSGFVYSHDLRLVSIIF